MSNDIMMSEKIDCLAIALSKAQSVIENVGKDKQGYGYKYADLASCLEAIKKPLSDNGLSIVQPISQSVDGKPLLLTLLIHESGQWIKSIFSIENVVTKNKQGVVTGNALQHFGAGVTYARRYALSSIIGLAQEDNDAQSFKISQVKEIELNPVKELINLCNESKLNLKEFTSYHEINSSDLDSVKKGVDNFLLLKEEFLNAGNTNIQ